MRIDVKVRPGSSVNKDEQLADNILKVWLTARPHDNEANDALIEYLAKRFKAAKSRVKIIKGAASKNKTVEIL